MTTFIKEGTFWCNEKALALAFMSIAKRMGFYPILGINGFLTYSRRELLESGITLPGNLVQGKGEVDIAFFDNKLLVLGAAATTTYAFIEYIGLPEKSFKLYTKLVFGSPKSLIDTYKELKEMGLRLPAPIVGKLYKTLLLLKSNARLKRLSSENREIIILSLIPFYTPRLVIESLPDYLSELIEYVDYNHGLTIRDYSVFQVYPERMSEKPPKTIYFNCIHGLRKCVPGDKLVLEDFPNVISGLRGCKGCRYIDICSRFLSKTSKI